MEKVRIQDDLFMAVNGEWYEKAVIPEDRASTGGFSDLDQEVEKTLAIYLRPVYYGKTKRKEKDRGGETWTH